MFRDQENPASEDVDYEGYILRLIEYQLESCKTRSSGTGAKTSPREAPTVSERNDITIVPPQEAPVLIEGTESGVREAPCEETPPLLLYVPTMKPFDFQKVLDAVPSVTRDEERLKRMKKAERWLKDKPIPIFVQTATQEEASSFPE